MRTADDESLPEAFWATARRLRGTHRETLAPWDITPANARAVEALRRHGELRLGDLSDHLHIAPRSTTEVVDVLEARGLVERRPDPDDRRATLVGLTDEGLRVAEAIRAARDAEAGKFFGVLSESDRAHLARILHKLRGVQI